MRDSVLLFITIILGVVVCTTYIACSDDTTIVNSGHNHHKHDKHCAHAHRIYDCDVVIDSLEALLEEYRDN